MTNNLVQMVEIDMVAINEGGTIAIIYTPNFSADYPIIFQYKLYLPFKENEAEILKLLFKDQPPKHYYTQRFFKYLENRASLYDEIVAKYFPIVKGILDSDFSESTKKQLIQKIDLELNKLYPYSK